MPESKNHQSPQSDLPRHIRTGARRTAGASTWQRFSARKSLKDLRQISDLDLANVRVAPIP